MWVFVCDEGNYPKKMENSGTSLQEQVQYMPRAK